MNASQQLRRIGYTNELVFLTKNTEQVFNSFEVEPMYYMVKSNTNLEKLESVFMKAVKKQDKRKQEYIALSCAGDNRNIPLDSIYYFEIVCRIIEVHYDLQPEGLHPARGMAGSGLRPLSKIPHCCLP